MPGTTNSHNKNAWNTFKYKTRQLIKKYSHKLRVKLNSHIAIPLHSLCRLLATLLLVYGVSNVYANYLRCKEYEFELPPSKFQKYNAKKQEEDKIRKYFFTYLSAKYPLYPKHLNYILDSIFEESKVKNLSPLLIVAIIETESAFNFQAKSNAEAYGLMQVHYPSWGKKVRGRATDLYDPAINIKIGTEIIDMYLKESMGNIDSVLAKYLGEQNKDYQQKVISLVGRYYLDLSRLPDIEPQSLTRP